MIFEKIVISSKYLLFFKKYINNVFEISFHFVLKIVQTFINILVKKYLLSIIKKILYFLLNNFQFKIRDFLQ